MEQQRPTHLYGDVPHELIGTPDWGFAELQGAIDLTYKEHNEASGYGPDTMFAKLVGNTVTLSKAIRKETIDFETVDRALVNVFTWTTSIANEAHLSLSEVISEKFSQGCPRCHNNPCSLAHDEPCEKTDKPFGGEPNLLSSLNGWQDYFASLYPNNYRGEPSQVLRQCASRLFEEVGELLSSTHPDIERDQNSLSHHDLQNDSHFPWRGEFADVLAWSFAVAESVKKLKGNYSVGKSLQEKYSSGCPYCHNLSCSCPREITVIDELSRMEPK